MPRARLALAGVLIAAAAGAPAARAVDPVPVPSPGPQPYFDIRTARAAPAPAPSAATRAARARLADRLGPGAALDADPATGTLRALQDLDGDALSGPAAGDRAETALRFARANAEALGLDAGDVAALGPPDRTEGPAGSVLLRFGQSAGGIPVFGAELRVLVDRAGRVLSAGGAPAPDLRAPASGPAIDAAAALRRAGARGPLRAAGGPAGPRRATRFAGGEEARLVLFAAGSVRLAWQVTYAAGSTEVYDAIVDARTGELLRRVNLVKSEAAAEVFELHPGAPAGGTARVVDLEARGYLPAAAPRLAGPFAHAYSDLDDSGAATPDEEVTRGSDGSFRRPFKRFEGTQSLCTPTAFCSWDRLVPDSWRDNREQATVQAFYAVNRFAEHLRSPAIGFDGFRGDDPVRVETDDGAGLGGTGIPPAAYRNNANMFTPRDGRSPRMQLYLFGGPGARTRDVNSADDTAVIFHEYTHGLSSRLVTQPDGVQALNSTHAAALGEAWSDWYAPDRLVREGSYADDLDAPGEIVLGRYYGGGGRSQPIDCPVGAPRSACPGGATGHSGGYTLGDFGRIAGAVEPHYDGEIWGQALWDLRTALVRRLGEQTGSDAAERLVTGGMRVTPPEPSFLDARNAIIAADAAAGGADRELLWSVFARRGMGYFASVEDTGDAEPLEDFATPPPAGAPRGTITGRITDADTGLPLADVAVGVGHEGTPGFLIARSGADGRYTLADVPAVAGVRVVVRTQRGYGQAVASGIDVPAAGSAVRDIAVERDWAAAPGGSKLETNADYYARFGCGGEALVDRRRDTGWLAHVPTTPAPTATVELPARVDVRAVTLDARPGCSLSPGSATRVFRIETSADGVTFATALEGSFTFAELGRPSVRALTANGSGVRFVRLSLLSSFDPSTQYRGFSALEVHGAVPNGLPAGSLTATPARVAPGERVRLDASSFRDPDSAITGYEWDLDGDGRPERTTSEPVTETAYPAPGRPAPRVFVRDFRGGAGTAQTAVDVVAPPAPSPTPPPPPPPPAGGLPGLPRSAQPPTLTIAPRGTRGRVAVRATCAARCALTGRLTADRRLARRLRASRTLGRLSLVLPRAGARSATLALPARTRARLRRFGIRRVRLTARATVRDAAGRTKTVTRRVRLRV